MAFIDLEKIPSEDADMERISGAGYSSGHGLVDVMQDMTGQDGERLYRLSERHGHYTNS